MISTKILWPFGLFIASLAYNIAHSSSVPSDNFDYSFSHYFDQNISNSVLQDTGNGGANDLPFHVADAGEKEKQSTQSSGRPDAALLSKKAANPISDVWLIWMQNDTALYTGDIVDGSRTLNSFKLQPVMPIPVFGGDWNFLIRPVFQFQSVPLDEDVGDLFGVNQETIITDRNLARTAADPSGRTTDLGDTALLTIAGPNKVDGFVWAAGITQIFPTASEDVTGQGKWQVGPAALLANFGKDVGDWNLGLLAQHWWSVSGSSKRQDTSLTDIQYFINYKASPTALIGMAPNIRINHEADSDDRYTVPIGLGYNELSFFGKLPFRWGVELQHSIVKPDNAGLDWNLRFYFIPILQNPFKK